MKNKVYITLGASNHTKEKRELHDYYATHPDAAHLLLEVENFKNILEPSCGEGHLSEVFKNKGIKVTSSDLIDRGYGSQKNFMDYKNWNGDIVTNPPYKYALEFIQHSLKIISEGNKVAMFLKLQFLEGKRRKLFFLKNPPQTLYVSSSRILCAKNGDFEKMKRGGGSAVAYGWYIWIKGQYEDTRIKWIN